jgi:lipopolysaccharide export system protein LptA
VKARRDGLIAFALAVAAAGVSGCAGPKSEGPAAAASASPAPARSASPAPGPGGVRATTVPFTLHSKKVGSRYIYLTKQKANRTVYVLRADSETGQYFGGNTGRSDFVNPHVTFYASGGRQIVADAPAGTLVEKEKTVTMTGGVHARTQDGKTLTSDRMRYNDDTETLYGDGDVVVTTPQGERLEGSELVWNLRSGRLDVTGAE